uniref:CBFD_NFYB_HMF domain-containing protein n=1 Tax=Angiostrongylus cantonensis TaxID=6313 RepID=A0A158PBI6_ANGCA
MSDLNPSNHEENPGPSSSVACLSSVAIPSSTAGPIRRRRFSAAKIQPTRIKKVMQSDEEIGRMVASVPVAIGRAMEHFAEKFLQLSSVVNLATTTSSPPVASSTLTARKAVNGKKVDTAVDGEKPKRGRPRKIKRSEKCLDEELCEEVTNGIEKEDQDRALMPPPALPLGRARPVA